MCTDLDMLWKMSLDTGVERPGWFGFMQMVENGEFPGVSSTHYLPIINLDPTNMTCVYSTLKFIQRHAKLYNVTPVVTFDQPLYWKALAVMQRSEITELLLLLGAFHTLMSYLGATGKLMEGTGIEKIFQLAYAGHSVTHTMSGKAVSHALRAYTILISCLYSVIIEHIYSRYNEQSETGSLPCITEEPLIERLIQLLRVVLNSKSGEGVNFEILQEIKILIERLKNETNDQRTSALWFQLLEMIDIALNFLRAERTGNWLMHLNAIKLMLPFLAATGHNNYVKSIYVYVQQMEGLSESFPKVYDLFISRHHSIWCSNRYWGGLSTDLIIEQCLMRNLKSRGGLTRGRGVTEVQRATWIMSAPVISEINGAIQELTNQNYASSEQHKEAYASRTKRDTTDALTIYNYIKERSPFALPGNLCNIATGVSAGGDVNVEQAAAIGKNIIKGIEGKMTDDMHFKQANQVTTFKGSKTSGNSSIKLKPDELFQRCIIIASKLSLEYTNVLKYELTPYPTSLFEDPHIMNEANKPTFADALWSLLPKTKPSKPNNPVYIFDGGALLYRVQWYIGQSFMEIVNGYVAYLKTWYEGHKPTTIVFDGYNGNAPKDSTHLRRTGGSVGQPVQLRLASNLTMNRKLFLSCTENKIQFIKILGEVLKENGFIVKYADGDADYLIAKTAFESSSNDNTILVGDDTALLVILLNLVYKELKQKALFFCPLPKPNSKKELKVWDIHFLCEKLAPAICEHILFLHAVHGCDTTSRLPGIRINQLWKLTKNPEFIKCASQFKDRSSQKDQIVNNGVKILTLIYGGNTTQTLIDIRTLMFEKKTKLHSEFKDIKTTHQHGKKLI